MLILKQDDSPDYKPRTEVNVKQSDVTMAIAVNFDSPGEKLTKSLALSHGKLYIPVSPTGDISEKASKIVSVLNKYFESLGNKTFVLNVAGNGIATLKGSMTQHECDEFTYSLLKEINDHTNLKVKICAIRSGGQTGFDEAGIKAGLKMKLETTAYYPKNYRIRDLQGDKNLTREEVLKLYGVPLRKKVYVDMDDTICDYSGLWQIYKSKFPDVAYPQSKFGFFSRLKPIPGALEALKELEVHYDIYILTRPSIKNIHSYSEKAEWVEKYLGEDYLERLILCPDKSLVKGDFLVDDWDHNGQADFEGKFLKFKTDKWPNWEVVKNYLLKFVC
jgi:5'(3')-deoxyribonucleotidase